jgi:hypothetical protein
MEDQILKEIEEIKKQNERVEKMMGFIVSVILVQQKDFCEAIGVSPDTVRNRVLKGDFSIFQKDGGRLNYVQLSSAKKLKPRKQRKKKKN